MSAPGSCEVTTPPVLTRFPPAKWTRALFLLPRSEDICEMPWMPSKAKMNFSGALRPLHWMSISPPPPLAMRYVPV